jgi:probable HAF family extracellular repeat protein
MRNFAWILICLVAGFETRAAANPFLYESGTFSVLNVPGDPNGINDAGQIVGTTSFPWQGYLYSGSTNTFSVPGFQYTYANGLNQSGQVAGLAYTGSGPPSPSNYVGFVYSGGSFTILNVPGATITQAYGINNSGQVSGDYYEGSTNYGFIYSNGKFTTLTLPGSTSTSVFGINDLGQVVGVGTIGGISTAFFYSNGIYTTLGPPAGSSRIEPLSINDSGNIVGIDFDINQIAHGFLNESGNFTIIDYPNAVDTFVTGINNENQLAGGFDVAPVPELSTWAMLLIGFAAIGVASSRRMNKATTICGAVDTQ